MKRKKKYQVGNMEDRISKLPDEILVTILSCLSLKEAYATSILSSRWRPMCSFNTILDFDADKCLTLIDWEYEVPPWRYVEWVDSIVEKHRAAKIERFRVKFEFKWFDLGGHVIDKWIRFAMTRGVELLEVNLSTTYKNWRYKFDNKVLGLTGNGFMFLKVVDFNHVDLDQHVVEYLINNCPVLERVTVCDSSALFNLRVSGDAIALKHLTIKQCDNLESIEIRDANLVSFTYGGEMEKLLLRNLPLLVEVCITGVYGVHTTIDFSYLSFCLSQLEILKIDDAIMWGKSDPVIPPLSNLKCLELALDENRDDALLQLAFYIKQAPRLHALVIKFQPHFFILKSSFVETAAAKCCHDGLKVVTFVGYCGRSRQIELVEDMIKTASNLETIILDPYKSNPFEDDDDDQYLDFADKMSRTNLARQLKQKLPASLEVVCL